MTGQELFNKYFDKGFDATEYYSRLENTAKFDEASILAKELVRSLSQERIADFAKKLKLLIISSTGCGDCKAAIPLIDELCKVIQPWEYRVVEKKYVKEMEYFQVGSKQPVPLVLFANPKGQIISTWIEKSLEAKKTMKFIKSLGESEKDAERELKAIEQLKLNNELPRVMEELLLTGEKAAFYK
ncbi:MAG: thioredoxin family protein [Candidatus Heimdallarchaeota archaeon]|nr:thioredoxin family protein [Candidatus Heimdallarchaeota archaeon]